MTNIYLNVNFIEKEQVKLLGGRWDSKLKKWYIPSGLDPANFHKWLPKENVLTNNSIQQSQSKNQQAELYENNLLVTYDNQINEGNKASQNYQSDQSNKMNINNINSISLSQLLQKVSLVVQNIKPNMEWIKAEVSEVFLHKATGHYYLELIETCKGVLLSKVKAIILKSDHQNLFIKFKQVTGSFLKPGMQVLILVKLNFSIQYGLSLSIKDLDPNYTLGDLAAKLAAIRETLKKEGIYHLNKLLPIPYDFIRIAVLSPNEAAGLGDFQREATLLQKHNLCDFYYYTAQFQGENATSEIIDTLNKIFIDHHNIDFDAIVIIRGGGAAMDLAWLNDYNIAKLICESKIIIFSGIGHERDNTIIDEVAGVRFDTPSKVIAHIFGAIIRNAKQAEMDLKDINNLINNIYINNYNLTVVEFNKILKLTELNILQVTQNLKQQYNKIHNHCKLTINYINLQLTEHLKNIKIILPKLYSYINEDLNLNFFNLYNSIKDVYYIELQEIQNLLANVISLGPKATLERGYTIARDISNSKVLTSITEAKNIQIMYLEFYDGILKISNHGEL